MSRIELAALDGARVDVLVIGGGINGASAAQHLAACGYSVVLAESQDFGAGASSRSSRLMHFGLRYLDRGEPLLNYFLNPGWFLTQCCRARDTMRHRAELVRTMPERMTPCTMHVPVYPEDQAAPWQMTAALGLINWLGGKELPVRWRRLKCSDFDKTPFVSVARDRDRLRGVYSIEEYQFDWPERLVADYVMDALRMGATCRNYTRAVSFERDDTADRWIVGLTDVLDPASRVQVLAKQIVNTAGPWIDRVLAQAAKPVSPQLQATKGTSIAIRLPAEYRGHAFAHFNRAGYPFYFCPWRDLHYIGPTETPFTGDPTDVRATAADLRFLIDEARYMMPGLGLDASRILYHWSGVRPMPFAPGYEGKQNLIPEFNDHASEGLPNFMSIPGGPLMVHRFTGRRAAAEVRKRVAPSGPTKTPSYSTRAFPDKTNSPPVNPHHAAVTLSHLKVMAREELPVSLQDLLLRRAGLGWTEDLSRNAAREAAQAVAADMGWSEDDVEREVTAYQKFVDEHFLKTTGDVEGTASGKSA